MLVFDCLGFRCQKAGGFCCALGPPLHLVLAEDAVLAEAQAKHPEQAEVRAQGRAKCLLAFLYVCFPRGLSILSPPS